MSHIITTSYANEKVAFKSYYRLVETMKDDPCEVLLFDNQYPLNRKDFVKNLCDEFRFKYFKGFRNVGCYDAYNCLLDQVPRDSQKVIFYGGDHYPMQENWHKAMLEVLDDSTVATVCLASEVNQKELNDRGYDSAVINGHRVKISHNVITCNDSGWNLPWLRSIGGISAPHKYYGGNEIEMWKQYGLKRKFVVLDDYWEDLPLMKALHDWQYEEYKLLYAHRGLNMSFEEYLKQDYPQFGVDVLLKEIFG